MSQVKNEEEKKKETVKKDAKKNTIDGKTTSTRKKTTSKTSTKEIAKKQTATKKSASTSKKAKIVKEDEVVDKKVVAKVTESSEEIKNAEETKTKKEPKTRSSKKASTVKDSAEKKNTTTKSDKASKAKNEKTSKTKYSKNSKAKSAKGKITKIIGSRNQEEIEDDVVITDTKETYVVKIDDEEKMQLVENEVKKDLKSKNKLPKTEERKLSSVVFENLCVAIAGMIYLFFIILGFINIKEEVYVVDLKVFSFIILIIAILLFERAYKKDSGKLCAFGIEVLFLSITTMGLLYANIEINNIFLPVAATVSLLFAIYYVAKSIYLYTKMKKSYFVDNMKDIIKKEEKE